eukprot:GHVT01030781.1.p1 GENE.GHVT01030781.1~~GHVT01030781.1.p1  ORF type:complete len:641 (-),score=140.59 GHVT01030781.1:1460-3337(-)
MSAGSEVRRRSSYLPFQEAAELSAAIAEGAKALVSSRRRSTLSAAPAQEADPPTGATTLAAEPPPSAARRRSSVGSASIAEGVPEKKSRPSVDGHTDVVVVRLPSSEAAPLPLSKSMRRRGAACAILKLYIQPTYWLIIPIFAIFSIRMEFIMKTAADQMPTAYNVWGQYLAPIRAIPCIIIGAITNVVGIFFALAGMNTLGVLVYLFAMFPNTWVDWCTCIATYLYTSYLNTMLYTYIAMTQPKAHFGKLTGVASLIAGLLNLVSLAMVYPPIWTMNVMLLGLSGLIFALLAFLGWRIWKTTGINPLQVPRPASYRKEDCASCSQRPNSFSSPSSPSSPSSSSSSSSSSPCGVNRWLALAIYVVILFLSAQTFGGWARGFREMLFRSGAYEWRCGSELEPAPYPDGPVCESQKIAVDNLWTVAYVSRAVGACPAGTILDLLGPKLTSLLGAGLVAVGWVLLAVSGPGFEGYIPALLLIAGAGEILALPLVTVANLFPKYEPLVLSICGAAKSSSAAVPVIMYSIWRAAGAQGMDLQGIAFAYAFGVVGALALIILLLVPYRRFGWVSAYPVGAELVESAGGDLSEKKMAGARSGPPSSSSTVPPSDLAPLSDDSKSTSLDIAPP